MPSLSRAVVVVATALLAVPISYCVNLLDVSKDPLYVMFIGVVVIIFVLLVPVIHIKLRAHDKPDALFYVISMFTFSSIIDLVISMENDGIIENFADFYTRYGEPYLKTAYGTIICYWDGTGHFVMYMLMLALQAWNVSYREVGLYWVGSIGHSMLILLPGSIVGKYGVHWSILLNVPYLIIPFWAGLRFLRQPSTILEKSSSKAASVVESDCSSIWKRPLDLLFVTYFAAATVVCVLRGFVVLGWNIKAAQFYRTDVEPYLTDPAAYPQVQMLLYMFYFVPYYLLAIYGLLYPAQTWMGDASLLHAGAAVQAQVGHIGASLHHLTPSALRVPQTPLARSVFWSINIALLVIPQLFAVRVIRDMSFFKSRKDPQQETRQLKIKSKKKAT